MIRTTPDGCLIRKKVLSEYVLKKMARDRPHLGITRVSRHVADQIDWMVKRTLDFYIANHPSIGKTFKLPSGIAERMSAGPKPSHNNYRKKKKGKKK